MTTTQSIALLFPRPVRHTLLRLLMAGLPLLVGFAHAESIRVIFPNQPDRRVYLNTFFRGPIEYLSSHELAVAFSINLYANDEVNKEVLYFRDGDIKITAFSSFVVVDDQAFQMPTASYYDGEDYFLPVRPFVELLGLTVMPGMRWDPVRRVIVGPSSLGGFNLHGLSVESKDNGTLIRIRSSREFDSANIVRYITDNGWLVIQIPDGRVDSIAVGQSPLGGIIRRAVGRQLTHSAEIRFKLLEKVSLPDVYQAAEGNELHVAIRNPDRRNGNRAEEMRKQWYMNTIVIDAGHGGKDGGTVGRSGLMEKTVVLDVALRLGRLIKQHTNMRVVYSRDEDVFVPLFQRTKMANEAGGKLFISIHINGVKSRSAAGFETWLLAPANTPEAIEMAARENSVIAMEESNHDYDEYSDETLILSTMAQSAWLKESEALAGIIQATIPKRLGAKNRGVKQADFFVLIGASMPNVLVELGFVSNRIEEQKLAQNEYRQKIALGLFDSIMEFKDIYEGAMTDAR